MLRRGLACSVAVAAEMGACRRGGSAGFCKHYLYQEVVMKVVLIENPKLISAILRKIYGIKKRDEM